MQVLDADFCENRLTVLQQFFDELLANPTLASQTSVHTLLGVYRRLNPKDSEPFVAERMFTK